jgi:hypothetical protein
MQGGTQILNPIWKRTGIGSYAFAESAWSRNHGLCVGSDGVRSILGAPQFTVKGYKACGRQEFRIAASASHRVCLISTWFSFLPLFFCAKEKRHCGPE